MTWWPDVVTLTQSRFSVTGGGGVVTLFYGHFPPNHWPGPWHWHWPTQVPDHVSTGGCVYVQYWNTLANIHFLLSCRQAILTLNVNTHPISYHLPEASIHSNSQSNDSMKLFWTAKCRRSTVGSIKTQQFKKNSIIYREP